MGCSGNGTNPEQLFAIGYAACFHSALRLVGRQEKTDISDSAVGAGFRSASSEIPTGSPDDAVADVGHVWGLEHADELKLGRARLEAV
jgi:hypothetical protein